MVNLKINGISVSVPEGYTILDDGSIRKNDFKSIGR